MLQAPTISSSACTEGREWGGRQLEGWYWRDIIIIPMQALSAETVGDESTNKEVNQRPKDVTETQQQRYESPTVTLTLHASKNKVHQLHQNHILVVT